MQNDTPVPYAPVLIKLLQGIVYQDEAKYWSMLLEHTSAVRSYFAQIGTHLYVDETEGYAYLHQPDSSSDEDDFHHDTLPTGALPRLARRIPLSYRTTLLCVLLREELQRFDMSGNTSPRLILTRDDMREMLRPFFPEHSDEKKLLRQILDPIIKKVASLGFLRELRGAEQDRYEVSRIIKARIPADSLAEIKEKLVRYARSEPES